MKIDTLVYHKVSDCSKNFCVHAIQNGCLRWQNTSIENLEFLPLVHRSHHKTSSVET